MNRKQRRAGQPPKKQRQRLDAMLLNQHLEDEVNRRVEAIVNGVIDKEVWVPMQPAEMCEARSAQVDAAFGKIAATSRGRILELWANNLFTVAVALVPSPFAGWPEMKHLSIKRNDRKPARDWRLFQKIKNEVCGPETEAVEIFPAESRLVDGANQYHLWVVPPGAQFPFGFQTRMLSESTMDGIVAQRPFDDKPADLPEMEAKLAQVMAEQKAL